MLMRVVKKDDEFLMLFKNGDITPLNKEMLFKFFKDHHNFSIQLKMDSWKEEIDNIEKYEANTVAYVNNKKELCIPDMVYFRDFLIDSDNNIENLLSVNEYAEAVGRTKRQILFHLNDERIPGAKKMGRDWFIPKGSVELYPEDNRVITGKYIKKR